VELEQKDDVLEVLHEFWVVNLAVALDVGKKVEGVALRDGEAKQVA